MNNNKSTSEDSTYEYNSNKVSTTGNNGFNSNNSNYGSNINSNYGNNVNKVTILSIENTILNLEENISFYNEQKKILKNLYKILLNKNNNIKKVEAEKVGLKEKIELQHGSINRGRGKGIYENQLKLKNKNTTLIKKEESEILNSIKNIVENNNFNIIQQRNNINNVKIKSNSTIVKIIDLTNSFTLKIKKLNDKIIQINTILQSELNNVTKDKTSIGMIYDLQELSNDIYGKNNLSTRLFQNFNFLNSSINEKYKRSKEYKNLEKKYNIYMNLLTINSSLILETLTSALNTRENYRGKINELINTAPSIIYSNNVSQNNKSRIMNKINVISKYRCIELDNSISDTIFQLKAGLKSQNDNL